MQAITKVSNSTSHLPANTSYVYPFIICLIYGIFSKFFFLSLVAGLVLSIIVKELWRPFIPAALLYFFVLHWAQVFTVVPYMDFINGNINHGGEYVDIHLESDSSNFLVIMSLLQVGLMALVVGFFLRKVKGINFFTIKRAVTQLNTKKILIAFLITSLIFPTLIAFTRSSPSLNQLVQSASIIRKIFLLLLIFTLFTKKNKLNLIIVLILVIEFLLGFTGFFSDFKEVPLFVLIVYLTVNPKLKPSLIFNLIPIVALLGFVLIYWSYIKPSYRQFVSGGSRQQVVVVGKKESLQFLLYNLKKFDSKSFREGAEILMDRIETMSFYFKVYDRVPAIIPHQKGKNTMSSVKFVALPRSLNEEKGMLDPSSKTTEYTGVQLATAEEGTSIAMGYFPDFYIDFGIYGMIIPLLLIAWFIGWASKYILQRHGYNMLFNYSLLIAAVFALGTIDSDLTFFLGVLRNLIALFIIGYLFLFPILNRFILRNDI